MNKNKCTSCNYVAVSDRNFIIKVYKYIGNRT